MVCDNVPLWFATEAESDSDEGFGATIRVVLLLVAVVVVGIVLLVVKVQVVETAVVGVSVTGGSGLVNPSWLGAGGCGLAKVSVFVESESPPPRSESVSVFGFNLAKWSCSGVLKALPGLEKGAWLNVASCGEGDRQSEGRVPPGPVRIVSAGAGSVIGPGLVLGLKKSWSSSSEESTS